METASWLYSTSSSYHRRRLTCKGLVDEAHRKSYRVPRQEGSRTGQEGCETACVAPTDIFGEIDSSIADLHSILLSL